MKAITTLASLFFTLIMLAGSHLAVADVFREDFENRVTRDRMVNNYNWAFQGVTLNAQIAITDTAAVSSPLTAARSVTTGWLYIRGNKQVNFKTRMINTYLVPNLKVSLIALNGTRTTLLNYNYINNTVVSLGASTGNLDGWYKIEWFWASQNGGNARVAIDDISTTIDQRPNSNSTFLADLAVTATLSSSTYTQGDNITYQVNVANIAGPDAARSVIVNLNTTTPLTLVSATAGTTLSGNRITISSLAMGATSTVTFTSPAVNGGTISSFTAQTGTMLNTEDYVSTNNSSTVSYRVMQPMPVELAKFTATGNEGVVTLNWMTLSEKNSSYFAIERQVAGGQFEELGRVDAKNNSTAKVNYTYADEAAAGTLRYRLRMVDIDGTTEYSPIVSVNMTATAQALKFSVYPNPGAGEANIMANQPVNEDLQVQVISATGAVIKTQTFAAGDVLRLSLEDLANGTYRLRVVSSQAQQVVNYIKL